MKTGDVARIFGLVHNTELNGCYCDVLTDLVENVVPEHDGVARKKWRHGVQIIGTDRSGYIPPEHLELVADANEPHKRRAIYIHLTGWEP